MADISTASVLRLQLCESSNATGTIIVARSLLEQAADENDLLRAIIDDVCEVLEHYDLPEHAFHYRRVLEGKVALRRTPSPTGKQTP